MAKEVSFDAMDGSELRIGLVYTKWSKEFVSAMVKDCKEGLNECKVKLENIVSIEVSGWVHLRHGLRSF